LAWEGLNDVEASFASEVKMATLGLRVTSLAAAALLGAATAQATDMQARMYMAAVIPKSSHTPWTHYLIDAKITQPPVLRRDSWLVVVGMFYTSTPKNRPEALAMTVAGVFETHKIQNAVQILRGVVGGKERNIIVVKASSKEEAQDRRDLLRSAGGDLRDNSK
jgi:hypothetical protein